jgi:hypothetical protein
VELAADGRQRGGDDGLVEGGQKHRQHQAHQDGADFALGQRRLGRDRRCVADLDDLGRHVRQIAGDGIGQCFLVSRFTAVPFELVHADVCFIRWARREAARNR